MGSGDQYSVPSSPARTETTTRLLDRGSAPDDSPFMYGSTACSVQEQGRQWLRAECSVQEQGRQWLRSGADTAMGAYGAQQSLLTPGAGSSMESLHPLGQMGSMCGQMSGHSGISPMGNMMGGLGWEQESTKRQRTGAVDSDVRVLHAVMKGLQSQGGPSAASSSRCAMLEGGNNTRQCWPNLAHAPVLPLPPPFTGAPRAGAGPGAPSSMDYFGGMDGMANTASMFQLMRQTFYPGYYQAGQQSGLGGGAMQGGMGLSLGSSCPSMPSASHVQTAPGVACVQGAIIPPGMAVSTEATIPSGTGCSDLLGAAKPFSTTTPQTWNGSVPLAPLPPPATLFALPPLSLPQTPPVLHVQLPSASPSAASPTRHAPAVPPPLESRPFPTDSPLTAPSVEDSNVRPDVPDEDADVPEHQASSGADAPSQHDAPVEEEERSAAKSMATNDRLLSQGLDRLGGGLDEVLDFLVAMDNSKETPNNPTAHAPIEVSSQRLAQPSLDDNTGVGGVRKHRGGSPRSHVKRRSSRDPPGKLSLWTGGKGSSSDAASKQGKIKPAGATKPTPNSKIPIPFDDDGMSLFDEFQGVLYGHPSCNDTIGSRSAELA